ncbi:RNA polymerase sigma factor SigJ, partial [Bacillus sp. D-CC]
MSPLISFQDVFISLNNIEDLQSIENMKAYLCKVATNRSIDKLRSAAHKRNVYVGMWLPEPLVEESNEPSESFVMKE